FDVDEARDETRHPWHRRDTRRAELHGVGLFLLIAPARQSHETGLIGKAFTGGGGFNGLHPTVLRLGHVILLAFQRNADTVLTHDQVAPRPDTGRMRLAADLQDMAGQFLGPPLSQCLATYALLHRGIAAGRDQEMVGYRLEPATALR